MLTPASSMLSLLISTVLLSFVASSEVSFEYHNDLGSTHNMMLLRRESPQNTLSTALAPQMEGDPIKTVECNPNNEVCSCAREPCCALDDCTDSFTYNGKSYRGCIDKDNQGRYWCSKSAIVTATSVWDWCLQGQVGEECSTTISRARGEVVRGPSLSPYADADKKTTTTSGSSGGSSSNVSGSPSSTSPSDVSPSSTKMVPDGPCAAPVVPGGMGCGEGDVVDHLDYCTPLCEEGKTAVIKTRGVAPNWACFNATKNTFAAWGNKLCCVDGQLWPKSVQCVKGGFAMMDSDNDKKVSRIEWQNFQDAFIKRSNETLAAAKEREKMLEQAIAQSTQANGDEAAEAEAETKGPNMAIRLYMFVSAGLLWCIAVALGISIALLSRKVKQRAFDADKREAVQVMTEADCAREYNGYYIKAIDTFGGQPVWRMEDTDLYIFTGPSGKYFVGGAEFTVKDKHREDAEPQEPIKSGEPEKPADSDKPGEAGKPGEMAEVAEPEATKAAEEPAPDGTDAPPDGTADPAKPDEKDSQKENVSMEPEELSADLFKEEKAVIRSAEPHGDQPPHTIAAWEVKPSDAAEDKWKKHDRTFVRMKNVPPRTWRPNESDAPPDPPPEPEEDSPATDEKEPDAEKSGEPGKDKDDGEQAKGEEKGETPGEEGVDPQDREAQLDD